MRSGLRQRRERGATIVEFAIVFPLIIMLVMGVAEFSLAFKDWLTINHASREGARAGATAADDISADIQVLTAIEQAVTGADLQAINNVVVSDPDGGPSTTYTYTGDPTCAWTPCPDPYAGAPPLYAPPYAAPNYLPETRNVTAPSPGRIKVSITLTHQWFTGLFADTSTWTADTIMRLEPRVFS
ncbi:MAG: TadE/TadG family type IV pilus assembly protein [Acidimicrobiia bacterium]